MTRTGPSPTWRRPSGPWLAGAAVLLACSGAEGTARVLIPPGANMRQAAESLAAHDVIRLPSLFGRYASLTGRDRMVKAGTYLIDRSASWNSVIDALVGGRGLVFPVTIPEGWELKTIVRTISGTMKLPIESLDFATRDTALLRRLGVPTATLEGYLFPETYLLPDGSSAPMIVRTLVGEFQKRWKPEWEERLKQIGMTRHQVVTLASIIEREARLAGERPLISAVYHNRLRRGMLLQADPTVQYSLGRRAGRVLYRDLRVDSPYNTYRHVGLPPGPIASPGSASLEAALFPADVKYLYFVAHPDGHHEFRSTLREHNEAVRRMRALRRPPAAGRP